MYTVTHLHVFRQNLYIYIFKQINVSTHHYDVHREKNQKSKSLNKTIALK